MRCSFIAVEITVAILGFIIAGGSIHVVSREYQVPMTGKVSTQATVHRPI